MSQLVDLLKQKRASKLKPTATPKAEEPEIFEGIGSKRLAVNKASSVTAAAVAVEEQVAPAEPPVDPKPLDPPPTPINDLPVCITGDLDINLYKYIIAAWSPDQYQAFKSIFRVETMVDREDRYTGGKLWPGQYKAEVAEKLHVLVVDLSRWGPKLCEHPQEALIKLFACRFPSVVAVDDLPWIFAVRPPYAVTDDCQKESWKKKHIVYLTELDKFNEVMDRVIFGVSPFATKDDVLESIWNSYNPCTGGCGNDLGAGLDFKTCGKGHSVCEHCVLTKGSGQCCAARVFRGKGLSSYSRCQQVVGERAIHGAHVALIQEQQEQQARMEVDAEEEEDEEEEEEELYEPEPAAKKKKKKRAPANKKKRNRDPSQECGHRCTDKLACKHACCNEWAQVQLLRTSSRRRISGKKPADSMITDEEREEIAERRRQEFAQLNGLERAGLDTVGSTKRKAEETPAKAPCPEVLELLASRQKTDAGEEQQELPDELPPPYLDGSDLFDGPIMFSEADLMEAFQLPPDDKNGLPADSMPIDNPLDLSKHESESAPPTEYPPHLSLPFSFDETEPPMPPLLPVGGGQWNPF